MSKWIGRQQAIGVAMESSRGTVVVPASWIPKVNFTVEDKAAKAFFGGNYNLLAGGDDIIASQKWSEGDMEFEVGDKNIGYILYSLFGSLTSASFNSVYKHTLALGTTVQGKTLSLFVKDPYGSVDRAFPMVAVNNVQFNAELGEYVKATVNFVGRGSRDWTSQTATYAAENKFAHQGVSVKVAAYDTTPATLNTNLTNASRINVQKLGLSLERAVIREHALGTVQPVDILSRTLKISGTMSLTYEDRTYRDYMLGDTVKALRIAFTNPTTIGSTTPQIQIDLPRVNFTTWEPNQPNDDVAMQDVNFEALLDTTNSVLIGANTFVVNSTASY